MTKMVTLQPILREDYTPPPYWIDEVHLTVDLDPKKTRVLNCMKLRPNAEHLGQPLRLNGEKLEHSRVLINGTGVSFRIEEAVKGTQLVIEEPPQEPFELEIFTTCVPELNTECQGLYVSQGAFFTQCEAESFRRITYFLDRPDVMAVYTVTIRADKKSYPVLLSNGNLQEGGDLEDGRHYAVWHDPFPKPSYLFALVAGAFVCRERTIVGDDGRKHQLQVYVRAGDLNKTEHAMNSLMHAIAWDEGRFGLKLDLDRFMVVAVSDFNMGAMENKGLNIFNTKYVLANPSTATDDDYLGVESVIGHEYFHNWTGNRVTCRDWFQLTLKEGLTVFRDQEFSMDMAGTPSGRAIQRIKDVRTLRAHQFPEDAGPMAHPIRPDSYVEMDNFYTATVYEKGAEVVRMAKTLIGRQGFTKGLNHYLQKFDGQAVTCEDFVQALVEANPQSGLAHHQEQFMRWYAQAGTPQVEAKGVYDAEARTYTLSLSQKMPTHPDHLPFVIPVAVGLLNKKTGEEFPLIHKEEPEQSSFTRYLILTQEQQEWVFEEIDAVPVVSLLRGFSAPVRLVDDLQDEDRLAILRFDSDPFNRWEAAQELSLNRMLGFIRAHRAVELDQDYLNAVTEVLYDQSLDAGLKALILTLPSETYIAEHLQEVDPQRIHEVRERMLDLLASALHRDWVATYEEFNQKDRHSLSHKAIGYRALANIALGLICRAKELPDAEQWEGKTYQRFKDAANMTERMGALQALLQGNSRLLPLALERFYKQFANEALVIDKWFQLQAMSSSRNADTLSQVLKLLKHPAFSYKNPNRVRSLVTAYCQANPAAFHRTDGKGYVFWVDQVLALNKINPQIGARLARALDHWEKLAEPCRSLAKASLLRISQEKKLRNEIKEVVLRALGAHAKNGEPCAVVDEPTEPETRDTVEETVETVAPQVELEPVMPEAEAVEPLPEIASLEESETAPEPLYKEGQETEMVEDTSNEVLEQPDSQKKGVDKNE